MTAAPVSDSEAVPSSMVGVVFSRQAVDLAAEAEGYIDTVFVELGDRFEAGEVLVRLESLWQVHARDIARANLALADAEVTGARYAQEQSREQATRRDQAPEAWSEEERSVARVEADLAGAAFSAALASKERAGAELRIAEDRLERTSIRAPFAGAVTWKHVSAGQRLSIGQPLLSLIAVDDLWVRFGASQSDLPLVHAGMRVEAAGPAGTRPVVLVVEHVAPALDPATGLAMVECSVSPEAMAHSGFVSGMTLRVRLLPPEPE